MRGKGKLFFYKELKDYVVLTLATIILVAGIYVFKFPNHFSFGGVTGIAIILAGLFPISASAVTFILNMLLLVVGFIFLGRSFGIKTIYVCILMSVLLQVMEVFTPLKKPLTDEPVLELIYAICLPAVGSAIMFNLGASSGGTDIVAMILRRYTPVNIGTALFVVDFFITIASCFVFDIKTGLFSFLGLLAKSLVIDNVIENINLCKYFTIICNKPDLICDFIHTNLNRSATIFNAEGSYLHNNKKIILTVMRRSEAIELRDYVKKIDPGAFIMITNSSEIIGKGFHGLN